MATYETKADETFVLHLISNPNGQHRTKYRVPGVIECRRKYTNRADETWLQLVPGHDFSRSQNKVRSSAATPDKSGGTGVLQFEDVQFHQSYPWKSHIHYKG
jgi:hypothetical protein